MKAFFEEYGFILVSVVVVMMLVAMVPAVGRTVNTQLSSVASSLEEKIGLDSLDTSLTTSETD